MYKKFDGYKVVSPDKTQERILSEFDKSNMRVELYPISPTLNMDDITAIVCDLVPNGSDEYIQRQFGKGPNVDLSVVSGLAELAERYVGGITGRGMTPRVFHEISRYRSIGRENIPDGAHVLYKSEMEQFAINARRYGVTMTNDYWDNCISLSRPDEKFVLSEPFVEMLRTHNGLCAGNTIEEALVHGVAEVVERSSMYRFFRDCNDNEMKKLKFIDINSIKDSSDVNRRIIDVIESMNVTIQFFDYSVYGIPTIIAHFARNDRVYYPEKTPLGYLVNNQKIGAGVATSPDIAAMRCLLEYLQIGSVLHIDPSIWADYKIKYSGINKSKEFYINPLYLYTRQQHSQLWNDLDVGKTIEKYAYKNDDNIINIDKMKSLYDKDLLVEINRLRDCLEKKNLEIFMRDKRVDSFDFPVIDVICVPTEDADDATKESFAAQFIQTDPRNYNDIPGHDYYNKYVYRIHSDNFAWNTLNKVLDIHKLDNKSMLELAESLEHIAYINYRQGAIVSFPFGIDIYKTLMRIYLHLKMYDRAYNISNGILSYVNEEEDIDAYVTKIITLENTGETERAEQVRRILLMIDSEIDIDKHIKKLSNIDSPLFKSECDFKCGGRTNDECVKCFYNYTPFKIYQHK